MNSRPGATKDSPDRAAPSRRGLGPKRVVRVAFAVSVLLHLAAIAIWPTLFERLGSTDPVFLPPDSVSEQGVEVIRLVDLARPEPVSPDDPDEIEELEEPAEEAEEPEIEALPGIEVVPLPPGAAERLRPVLVDERLWTRLPEAFYELSPAQMAEIQAAGRIMEWIDSAQAAWAAEEALTDWTYTDADGGRWGISPGKLHLGDVTLPLPINFGEPVGRREENARLVWQWEEIMRQSVRQEVEYNWRERAAAIRARRDAERAAERAIVVPDTSRRR